MSAHHPALILMARPSLSGPREEKFQGGTLNTKDLQFSLFTSGFSSLNEIW